MVKIMKNRKMTIKKLKVKSFITQLDSENEHTVKGGITIDYTPNRTDSGIPCGIAPQVSYVLNCH